MAADATYHRPALIASDLHGVSSRRLSGRARIGSGPLVVVARACKPVHLAPARLLSNAAKHRTGRSWDNDVTLERAEMPRRLAGPEVVQRVLP